jgi:hypothetical protein
MSAQSPTCFDRSWQAQAWIARLPQEDFYQAKGVASAWDAMLGMTRRLDAALSAVEQRLPADFPMELAQSVFQGVRQHLDQFNRGDSGVS